MALPKRNFERYMDEENGLEGCYLAPVAASAALEKSGFRSSSASESAVLPLGPLKFQASKFTSL